MARTFRRRLDDSTFALNLAPMLDIIVSITPMLLLSVVFVKINVIESPLPQAVQEAIQAQKENPEAVSIQLKMEKDKGFEFVVNDNGQTHSSLVALVDGKVDLEALKREAVQVKQRYPQIFRLDLMPSEHISLNDIVAVMDKVRKVGPQEPRFAFNDPKTGSKVETDLLFPNVIFSNVMGD
jgi:biopolymer transport protein ExbD